MRNVVTIIIGCALLAGTAFADSINLMQVTDRLLIESTRGRIIQGQFEVSEAKFNAQRLGYYLPEISFNTQLPSYTISQTYQNYPGASDPFPFKGTTASGFGNIQLKQKVFTGGDLTVQGRIDISNREYPDIVYGVVGSDVVVISTSTATDKRRLRDFRAEFSQPILRTSESRSAYFSARENLERSRVENRVARADLKKEGATAFFELFMADIDIRIAENQSELAAYNTKWDSVKFEDSVITEEAWIESKSTRLEKKLALFDTHATYREKLHTFNHLLDFPSDNEPELIAPAVVPPPGPGETEWYLTHAPQTGETELARMNMESAERNLHETSSSSGLNGTLNASYAVGRGTVERWKEEGQNEDEINTNDWRVSLDFTYPIWDGGASNANVHSMELAYESARLEYLSAERSARNNMEILLKRIEINYAKLELLDQELALAERKLRDAEERHAEGIISDATFLENKIYYDEAQKSRLSTLKDYYLDLTELEKTGSP